MNENRNIPPYVLGSNAEIEYLKNQINYLELANAQITQNEYLINDINKSNSYAANQIIANNIAGMTNAYTGPSFVGTNNVCCGPYSNPFSDHAKERRPKKTHKKLNKKNWVSYNFREFLQFLFALFLYGLIHIFIRI